MADRGAAMRGAVALCPENISFLGIYAKYISQNNTIPHRMLHLAKKAIAIFEECVKRHLEVYGEDHRETITVIANLAMAYQAV